jgi:hypothetical protein
MYVSITNNQRRAYINTYDTHPGKWWKKDEEMLEKGENSL